MGVAWLALTYIIRIKEFSLTLRFTLQASVASVQQILCAFSPAPERFRCFVLQVALHSRYMY